MHVGINSSISMKVDLPVLALKMINMLIIIII